ncbi:outer membrane beta-barrel protein [Vibrio variabilis]|uniref:outer membrane beta-barrel protein n=1 Tax=Vibrio variabilis TaxID=990271 RepID=UPI000DD70ADF|nr:outer membrane beta-barrel protein [Vibrio variabilis]
MKKQTQWSLALIASIGALYANAATQEPSYYVGAKIGGGHVSQLDNTVTDLTSVDKNVTTWSAYAGIRALPWLAAEIGYVDLGKISLSDVDGDYTATGVDLAAKAIYNINDKFDLFFRAGVFVYEWKANGNNVCCNDSYVTGTVGAGVEYQLAEKWSALVDYKYYPNVGGTPDFHTYSIGAQYTF